MRNDGNKARVIFLEAIEYPPERRVVFLDDACSGDAELRDRVERLLRSHEQLGSFHDVGANAGVTVDQPITEKPGTQIGRYKLLQQIGEGGMGVVYMAEQKEPVKRRVALKIIKPGMDTRQVIARFEAERQALAMMDHPNIAKVLDAGQTESGRPYFVMELVNGVSITQYCDEQHLTPKERLELFVPICQAVQHAHQKGIIHRDLKPSNILVAEFDHRAVPKIIDFGVAKATSQTLTEKTMFTQLGQIVGTLEYMSPEQAKRNQLDVDTRSDIYSLGVVLYELLTGETPFDRTRLRSAAFDEMLRIIREEEPSKPSKKVSSSQLLPSIAANRRIEPAKLGSMMRGELDWIVLKAMEKDRGRRYETASKFAEDVQHYLNDEAVVACPPSAAYRFRKLYRRNRVAFVTASLVAASLVLGIVGSTWQAVRATRAESLAEQRLMAERQARSDAVKARQAEARQRERAESERARAEAQRSVAEANFRTARRAVDRYFTTVSDHELLHEAGMEPLRKSLLEAALEYYHDFTDQQADDPAVLGELAAAYSRIAQIDAATGSTQWPTSWERYLDIVERLYKADVDPTVWAGKLEGSFSYNRNAGTPRLKDLPGTLRTFQRGVDLFGALSEKHPDVIAFQEELATHCLVLGLLLGGVHRQEASRANYLRALNIWQDLARKNPGQPLYASHITTIFDSLPWNMNNSGLGHEVADLQRAAIETLREAYGDENDELAFLQNQLAKGLIEKGQLDEAETRLRESVEVCERRLNQQTTPRSMESLRLNYAQVCESLGEVLFRKRRSAEAAHFIQKAGSVTQELVSQTESPAAKDLLIESLQSQGKLNEALEEARSAARRHPNTWYLHQRLRKILDQIGDTEKTLAVMRENAQLLNSEQAHHQYGLTLLHHERLEEAAKAFVNGISIKPTAPWSYYHIAGIRLQQDRLLEALDAARSAVRMSPTSPIFHTRLLEVINQIGDAGGSDHAGSYAAQLSVIFPNNSANLSARMGFVDFLASAERFQEAAQILEGMDESDRGSEYERALLYVYTRQLEAHRRLCQVGLDREDLAENVGGSNSIAVQCRLAPNALTDYTTVLNLLENAVNKDPNHRLLLGVRAHLLYRSNDAKSAVKQLDRLVATDSVESSHWPINRLFLAMAQHDLGYEGDAAQYFREAAEWIDKNGQVEINDGAVLTQPLSWQMRLELRILYSEAEQLQGITQTLLDAADVDKT